MTTETQDPSSIVAQFVENHVQIDKYLTRAHRVAQRMAENVEDGLRAGMLSGIEAKQFLASHRAATGKVAEVAMIFADLHHTGYEIAKANGITLGRITSVGGVDLPQPEFTTFDGGR